MKKLNIFLLILPAMLLFSAASAQTNMFLKIDKIPGESKDEGHKEWINLLSFKQGVNSSSTASLGRSIRGGATEFNDIIVIKKVDKATPLLMQKCASGEMHSEMVFAITSADGRDFYTIRLTNVRITSVTSSSDCNPQCETREEVTFNYSKIGWEYSGKDGSKVQAGWDVIANRKM